MRVLVQRVARAAVRIDGRVIGAIDQGLAILVGFTHSDGLEQLEWMAEKLAGLRLFADGDGTLNRSVVEVGGALLVVSQFTLYGDAAKGRRPSFVDAARPEHARPLYDRFIQLLGQQGLRVETGEFGAAMQVEIVNDGPVTLWIER